MKTRWLEMERSYRVRKILRRITPGNFRFSWHAAEGFSAGFINREMMIYELKAGKKLNMAKRGGKIGGKNLVE
jgi:hypothetical protein